MSIRALEKAVGEMPQIEFDTKHFHVDGMYARVLARDKNVLLIGKVHKRRHLYIVTKGRVAVSNDGESATIYVAGDVIVSEPGTKRAVYALEDSICMTVHRTDKTDLDEIEEELIEPAPTALFDARNKLKEIDMTQEVIS